MKTQFDRFHDDLSAAIAAGVPIQFADSSRRGLTQNELAQSKELMASHLAKTKSNSLAEAIDSVTGVLPRYKAALQVFAKTETMLPLFECLSTEVLARKKVAKALRHAFYYLFVLLGLTLLGLLLYSYQVVPSIQEVRQDVALMSSEVERSFDLIAWVPLFTMVLSCCLGLMLIWFLCGGLSKVAMWCGGREYIRKRTSYIALRTAQLLIESGTETTEAVELSCTLANCDSVARENVATAFASEASAQDSGVAQDLADYFAASANERLNHIRTVVPITMVTIVGGLTTLVYCMTVFGPFVGLIWDVANAPGGIQ